MNLLNFESEAGKQFRVMVKGNNFMTPNVQGYVEIRNGIVEISSGPKFIDQEMWGITVIRNNVVRDDLSKCLNSYEDVVKYIKELSFEDDTELVNLLSNIQ